MELLRIELQQDEDVLLVRRRARMAAQLLGLDLQDQTRVATAVSELARYAYLDGPGAAITFALDGPDGGRVRQLRLRVTLTPARPRSAGVEKWAYDDSWVAADRLMDELVAAPDGGVEIYKAVAGNDQPPDAVVDELRTSLAHEPPRDALATLKGQNAELAVALAELHSREVELMRLNQELEETNRGVLALYAELESRSESVRRAQRLVFEELEDALRPPVPTVPNAQLAVRYVPAQHNSPTGGDLYDWTVLPDGTLHLCVVDVVGHGVDSTRDALHVTHAVRTLTLEGHRLGRVIERADALLQSAHTSVVATVLLARVDLTTGVAQLAGGGHPPALVVPATGAAHYVEAAGRPVGYPEAGSDEVSTVRLGAGDTLLLYTDGLIEASRDIVLGLDLLCTLGAKAAGRPLEDSLEQVLSQVRARNELRDDTLLLGLRYTGS